MSDVVVPDLIEPIVGWRAWDASLGRTAWLESVTRTAYWPPGDWLVADCDIRSDHDAPRDFCSCGIYAARDRAHLLAQGYHDSGGGETIVVIGTVELAGRVIVCERGYRAERARPQGLIVPFDHWEFVRPLRKAYGIPVELDDTFRRVFEVRVA